MNPISSWFWPAVIGGTVALGFFSWFVSLRAKRHHGIARFFAFESILLLTLLNIPFWFREPFSPLQICSWLFLTASLLLAVHSILLYHGAAAHRGQFENSTRLVVRGAYRFIRHPMYASLALLGLGVFLKRATALTAILAAIDLLAVYLTARIEEREMRARFGSEFSDYMRKTRMFVPYLFFLLAAFVPIAAGQKIPFIRYTVIPDVSGSRITVEADLRLSSNPAYLKDFNQLESIRWFMDGKEIPVKSERAGDLVLFKDLPAFGEARAVYTLSCVTDPAPGYRKRLMGSPSFIMAREGLYLGVNGKEVSEVEVAWRLPPGWTLALGREGIQRFSETQRTLWVAGKMADVSVRKLGEKTFKLAVLEGVTAFDAERLAEALKTVFAYAWEHFGELDEAEFGVSLFPHGSIGGGTSLYRSLAGEDRLQTVIHEMLHWWTNFLAPAWFREGAHDYIALKIMIEGGILPPEAVRTASDAWLQERLRVVKREGKVTSLAETSEAYDAQKPSGDIYAFAPLFAANLDREIRDRNPKASLGQVFAAVCRMRIRSGGRYDRPRAVDLPALILELTGYDPGDFFKKYFFTPVENAEIMLK